MVKNWKNKFARNVARFERRFELCGYYDEFQLPHGGPESQKTRRSAEDDDELILKYDKSNPVRGLQQIFKGFETCKLQPSTQVDRANKWNKKLLEKLSSIVTTQ